MYLALRLKFSHPAVIYYYLTFSLIFMKNSGVKLLARSDDNLYAKLIYKARIRKPAA